MSINDNLPYRPPGAQFAAHDHDVCRGWQATRCVTPAILTFAAAINAWQTLPTLKPILYAALLLFLISAGLALRKTWAKYLFYSPPCSFFTLRLDRNVR